MGLLTRAMLDSFLAAEPPLVVERVPCPEWRQDAEENAYVCVKMLTCAQFEVQELGRMEGIREVYAAMAKLGQLSKARAESMNLDSSITITQAQGILEDPPTTTVPLIIATVCDDRGVCLFTEEDADSLAQQSPALIKRLYDAALKLNSTGPDAVEKAVKNFASRQNSDSGTVYQANGVCPSDSPNNC